MWPIKIFADKGTLEPFTKNFEVKGNVQIEAGKRYRFFTEVAWYRSQRQLLETERISIRGAGEGALSLEGESLAVDFVGSRLEVSKPLVASEELQIKGQLARLQYRVRRLQFEGFVEIDLKKYKLTGKRASLVYYGQSFKPRHLFVKGQARLTGKNIWAISEKIGIDLAQRQYTFEGKPRLLYHNTELKGEKIVFNEKSKAFKWKKVNSIGRVMNELKAYNLSKKFKSKAVVKSIHLTVKQGQTVGLLGPNGAGKTTSFYMVAGLLKSDSGEVFINDHKVDHLSLSERAQKGLGYLPQEASIFRKMTVEENIQVALESQGVSDRLKAKRVEEFIEDFQLQKVAKNLGYTLSGGGEKAGGNRSGSCKKSLLFAS